MRDDLTPEQREHGEPMNYYRLVQQLVGYYLMFYVLYLSATISGPELLLSWPIIPALLFSFVYAHNTINIQVAHVTKQIYNPWTKLLLFNVFAHAIHIALVSLKM